MPSSALALLAACLVSPQPSNGLDRHIYPLAEPKTCPPVVVDVSEFPEGEAWGNAAKGLVETWFGTLTTLLATEDYEVPDEIRLVIKKEISAPAWASGSEITISGKWITEHPDDLGVVIHELVHVIQQYPNSRTKPGWLVEGIADYIRWWRYEPEAPRPRIDPERNNYDNSYRTTAYFLAWTSRKYNMGLVPALDRALRKREDPMPVFKELTGKEPAELWKEFVATKP